MMRSSSVSVRAACLVKKLRMDAGGTVEDDVDVGVARGPEVFEQAEPFSAKGAVASRR